MREMDPGKGNGLYENLAEGKAGMGSKALGRSRRLHGAQATRLWDKRRRRVLGIGSQLRHNPESWRLPPEVRGFLCWWRFALPRKRQAQNASVLRAQQLQLDFHHRSEIVV